jgi:carbon-monoxide dehydrogenase small subunit
MLAEGYLAERPGATKEEIREVVASNLCRCTGYQTIVEAIDSCASARRESP